jgi:hypothetical protein
LVGAKRQATFALSDELLFQLDYHFRGLPPFHKDYSLIVSSSTEKTRFFSASFRLRQIYPCVTFWGQCVRWLALSR